MGSQLYKFARYVATQMIPQTAKAEPTPGRVTAAFDTLLVIDNLGTLR